MNISIIVGNLTKDPLKVEGTEKTLARLNVACKENYTDEDGNRPSQFFNVCVWGAVAENCLKYLKKGSKVAIIGKIQNRSWEQDGVKKYATEIIASEIEFISTANKEEKTSEDTEHSPIDDNDLPF